MDKAAALDRMRSAGVVHMRGVSDLLFRYVDLKIHVWFLVKDASWSTSGVQKYAPLLIVADSPNTSSMHASVSD